MALLVLLLVLSDFGAVGLKDSTMDKPELAHFFLPPQDKYLDWYKVTDSNLPQRVLQSVDCWIVALCPENQLPAVWRNYILGYRGTIFFGRFWDKDGKDLKERFGYEGKPLLLVYKWTREAKKSTPKTTDDLGKALEIAVESMPVRNLSQISFVSPDSDPTNMDQFLLRAFYGIEQKPKFPIVFVYDADGTGGVPPIFRVVAHYFAEYFHFGLVDFSKVDQLSSKFTSYPKPKPSELPQPIAIIGKEPSDAQFDSGEASLSFQLVVMSRVKFGEFNFNNLVTFLFWVNENFRETLPGRTKDESLDDQTIKSVRNKLWWRIEVIKPAQAKKEKAASNLDQRLKEATAKFGGLKEQAKKQAAENLEQFEKIKEQLKTQQMKVEL